MALTAVYRVGGDQIAEQILAHEKEVSKQAARRHSAIETARPCRHTREPKDGRARTPTSSPAVCASA